MTMDILSKSRKSEQGLDENAVFQFREISLILPRFVFVFCENIFETLYTFLWQFSTQSGATYKHKLWQSSLKFVFFVFLSDSFDKSKHLFIFAEISSPQPLAWDVSKTISELEIV